MKLSKIPHSKNLIVRDLILAGVVFLLGLVLYVRTLAPGLLLGDSSEFQTLSYTLGIAHNTGYPIYLLLGKLFTYLPVGDVAYRVNLLSAVCAAAALAVVYLMGLLLTGRRWLSLTGALLLMVNALYWWQAVIAEVYTPAAAFTGGVLFFVLLWGQSRRPAHLFTAGMLGGLSLGVHLLTALAAPAILIYLLIKRADRQAWKAALLGGLIGFLIFVLSFVALDAYNHPTGMTANFRVHASAYGLKPEDFDSAWVRISFIFFSRQWRGQMFSGTSQDVTNNLVTYLDRTWSTFGLIFFFLILIGTISLFSSKAEGEERWKEGLLLVGSWMGMMIFLLNYRVGDLEVFFIPVYVILAVFLSEGAAQGVDGVSTFLRTLRLNKPLMNWLVGPVLMGICLWSAWPYLQAAEKSIQQGRISFLDESRIYYPYPVLDPGYPLREARRIASLVEDDAILFINWDMLYAACYAIYVDQKREGPACYEPMPFGTEGRMAVSAVEFIRENIGRHPIYISVIPEDLKSLYRFKQVGFTYPLYRMEKK